MAYDTFEESAEQSEPIELYEFSLGGAASNYTSAEQAQTVSSVTYEPLAIKHGARVEGPEERQALFSIEMPIEGTLAAQYVNIVPGQRATIKVKRFQKQDTGGPEIITIFDGSIRSVTFDRKTMTAKLACQPLITSTSRPAPRIVYSGACNHILYDERCKVLKTSFQLVGTVSGVNDNVVTVPGISGFALDYFVGGYIEAFGGSDARLITAQSGDTVTMRLPFPSPITSSSVTLYAGCRHDAPTCQSKFNNLVNYGGFPFVPLKNPFESGLV